MTNRHGWRARALVATVLTLSALTSSGCALFRSTEPGTLVLDRPDVPAPLSQWEAKNIDEALAIRCLNRGGPELGGCHGTRTMRPSEYLFHFEAKCQSDTELTVAVPAGAEVHAKAHWWLPDPAPRYLVRATEGWLYPSGDEAWPNSRGTVLPPASEVTLIAKWPDRGGKCSLAVVQVVDVGGAMPAKAVAVVPLDSLVEARPVGQSPTEWVTQETERARVEKEARDAKTKAAREKATEVSAQETKSGRCTPERNAYFQQVLGALKPMMQAADLIYSAHAITPAGSTPVKDRAGLAGEYHVIVMGYEKVSLDVRGADGQAAAMSSPYAGVVGNLTDTVIDSRVLQANALEKFTTKVNGTGCAMVVTFLHHE